MKYKKNNNKFKFPVDIKGTFNLPNFDLSENFETLEIKKKISSEINDITVLKNKNKKCQSNKLI